MESTPQKLKPLDFTLVLSGCTILSLLVVFCQNYNMDEGNFLYAAHMLFSGLRPYQDFFVDKLPLLLIVYGLPQLIISGLFVGRLTAAAFFLGTVVLIMLIGEKISGRRTGIIAGGFYGLKMSYIVGHCLVFTYAPSIFFFCLALYFFFDKPSRLRWPMTVLFWSLATQVRQIYATSMLFFFLVEYKKSGRSFAKLFIETAIVTTISCLYLIPFLYGNDNALHDLFLKYLNPTQLHSLPFWTVKLHWLKGTINEYYPELILGCILLPHYFFFSKKKWRHPHTLLGAMIIILILTNFKSYFAYSIQNLITAPLMALLIGISINNLWKQYPQRGIAAIIIVVFLLIHQGYPYVKRNLQIGTKFYTSVKSLGKEIAKRTRPDDLILSFNNHLLVESNRESIRGMSFSLIALSTIYDDEKCKKLHVTNPKLLIETVAKRQVEMVEISNRMTRILKNMLGSEWLTQFSSAIQDNYKLVFKYPDPYENNGKLFLFQLKPQTNQVPPANASHL